MYKRIFREIKLNAGRYLALFVLTVVAVGMYVGFLSGTGSAETVYKNFLESNNLEDGYFTLDGELGSDIRDDVEKLGVEVYENYYVDFESQDDSTVRTFKNRSDVDIPQAVEGDLPSEKNDIFLDQIYAQEKGIEVGDKFTLAGTEYTVSGVGAFPDYTISLENSTQMIADRSTFGVAMVAEDAFEEFDANDIFYNYSFLYEDRNLTYSEKSDKLREIVKTLACVAPIQNYGKLDDAFDKMSEAKEISAYSGTENNKRVSSVTSKMESNKSMAVMFVGVVIIIIAFLYVIFTKQTMQQECSVLGTIIALGIRKGEIILSYLLPPCLVTAVGSLVGCLVGATVLCSLPLKSLTSYYSLPITSVNIGASVFEIAILVPIILILVINVVFIARYLTIKPLKLIRKDIKKAGRSRSSHFNIMSFDFRFRLRMFCQGIGAYLLLFIGVFWGGWLMMFGIGMSSSFNGYIDNQKNNAVSQYQYGVSDEYTVSNESAEEATSGSFDYYITETGKSYSLTGIGVAENSTFFDEIPDLDYGEIAISSDAAKKFNLEKGEVVSLENAGTGEKDDYEIVDIVDYNMGLCVFTSQKEMNNILHKDINYHNYYFSDEKLDIPEDKLVSEMTADDFVNNGEVMKSVMQAMIMMFPVVAVVIYLIIMYLLIHMVISQNKIGISMMKIFGFTEKEIRGMYINTNTIVAIVLILVSLPLQYLLMVSVWPTCISSIPGYVDFIMGAKDFAIIGITGFVCYMISNLLSLRKISKISMVTALKEEDM